MGDMPSESQTILDLYNLHDRRKRDGTAIGYGYDVAARRELDELNLARSPEEVRDEYGDVLANVLLLGAALGIRDPMACAQATVDKVNRRLEYIYKRARTSPGEPGHVREFGRLWEESKLARTNGRDANLSSTDPSVVAGTDPRKDDTASG